MSRLQANSVIFAGNATRDAEIQHVNDKPVMKFSLAQGKDQNAIFLNVSYFVKENDSFQILKGDNVFVEGYLNQWTNKEGNKVTDLKARRVVNLSRVPERDERMD